MASTRKPEAAQYIPSPIPPNRQPIRVDPKHPLPSPKGISQNAQRSPLINDATAYPDQGLARTTSRRRKISGQNYVKNPEQSPRSDVLPPAPDAPRAPPVSYRDAYGNGASPNSASSKSFAARARTIPESVDPRLANSIAINDMPVINSSRPTRRGSVNQSSNRPDQQAPQQGPSLSFSSRIDQSSPQDISSTTTPRQQRVSNRAPVPQRTTVNDPPGSADVNPSLARAGLRLVSAGTAATPSDWAADRSPLQKLEVKLNDISKEEKRARVQEAEQLLRESKAAKADRRTSRGPQSGRSTDRDSAGIGNASPEQYTVRDTAEHTRSPHHQVTPQKVTHHRLRHGNEIGSERHNAVEPNTPQEPANDRSPKISSRDQLRNQPQQNQQRSVQVNGTDHNEGRGVRFQNQEYTDSSVIAPATVGAATFDGTHDRSGYGEAGVPVISPREHRRRTLQQQSSPIDAHGLNGNSSRQVPVQQQQLYTNRVEPPSANDSAATYGGPPDPVPGHTVPSHEHALQYEVPPQTAAGIAARKRVGFGSEQNSSIIEAIPNNKHHHLSGVLHHGRHHADAPSTLSPGRPRHLDEWKLGGVARLTLADTVADVEGGKGNKAWWEGNSAGQQTSSGAKLLEGNSRAHDGNVVDSNGMLHLPISIVEEPSSSTPGGLRDSIDSVRVRQYIGYDGTLRVWQRNRSWFLKPDFIMGAGRPKAPQHGTSHTYSYDCSRLAEHDYSHIHHICQPYLSKELTKSMRGVRIRVPAASTTFNPPLYLKCGPLLRYTGLKREKHERSSAQTEPSHGERETWRGTVMIVTVDAESSYDPAPTLRLFHQPISLLPPPPQRLDGEDGEDLPSEYVDPIAGLPRMTRTGKTVYVKPVEDLEEGVDVSQIENDDGLYEETRTANVPTSYGKADELLGRSPLPYPAKTKSDHRDMQQSGKYQEVRGIRLHAERGVTFWRFNLEVELGKAQVRIAYRINQAASIGFWVPAKGQTMNIMFHSCNGFSLSVK